MQVQEIRESPLPWGALVTDITDAAFVSLQASNMLGLVGAVVEHVANMTAQPDFSALSSALDLHQRSSGFDPVLTAADMRLVILYSQHNAAHELLKWQPGAPEAHQWLEAGLSANRQLLQQDPTAAASLHYMRGALLAASNRRPGAVAAFRSALREAPQHKCE